MDVCTADSYQTCVFQCLSHTNGLSIINTIGVVMNRLVGVGLNRIHELKYITLTKLFLRHLAQCLDLEFADLVCACLSRPRDVAVNLDLDLLSVDEHVLEHVGYRVLPGPPAGQSIFFILLPSRSEERGVLGLGVFSLILLINGSEERGVLRVGSILLYFTTHRK